MNNILYNYNSPCRLCNTDTGRHYGCHDICERYRTYYKKDTTVTSYLKDVTETMGNYMGYLIHPLGKVISKNRNKFLDIDFRGDIPFVSLSENAVTSTYRLDQVVWKSYHCTYVINSKDILHKDGNQRNCRIKNLSN